MTQAPLPLFGTTNSDAPLHFSNIPIPSLLQLPSILSHLLLHLLLSLLHRTKHPVLALKQPVVFLTSRIQILLIHFMAAIMFQGCQPCYESQILEPRTGATLRLTFPCSKSLTPPQPMDLTFKSSFFDSNSKTRYSAEIGSKTDTGGYSFLQALSNVRHGGGLKEPSEKQSVYVHPQAKRSSSILCEKSLQLCTENLGNETGTDIVGNNSIDLLCCSSERGSAGDSPTREQTRAARPVLGGKKGKTTQNFPPPLTTMRGSESLRVRPHREEGRLVIEAVRVTSSASCFKAERSHGRLRLCLLKNEFTSFDYEEDGDTDEKEEVESEMNEDEVGEKEEKDERDGEREGLRGYDRVNRCREGECENNETLMLEPLWVTTA